MAEVKLRLNLDAEEVELVVDGKVAITSGQEVFKNWVEAYNAKHKPVETPKVEEPVKVEAPVVEEPVKVEEPVAEPVLETPATEVDTEKED